MIASNLLFILFSLLCISCSFSISLSSSSPSPVAPIYALINRVLKRNNIQTSSFNPIIELVEKSEGGEEDSEWFEISRREDRLLLRGNSLPALSAAFGHYLRYYANCDFSWEGGGGYQLGTFPMSSEDVAKTLPEKTERVEITSKIRYYQNTCTASYTFAWTDWTSYEQEIDWMAMSGINYPLAFTGQEYLWEKLYRNHYNVSSKGLDQFFTGPGFFAWNRMSNMRAFAGPLSRNWLDKQAELQRNILIRYGELGIVPVLPAFNGVVPEEMATLYPEANITRIIKPWCALPDAYCCNYIVSPTDPLFKEIGSKFLQLQDEVFGTFKLSHMYNADTFNENKPNSNDTEYLSSSSRAVYESMVAGDPEATWLMQGWLFVEDPTFWTDPSIAAYLSGVPDDKMIILDLTAEEDPVWSKIAANNKRFVWCMLHNYGGARALYGNLTHLSLAPSATQQQVPKLFYGIGLTMEAINQNPVVYNFMTEVAYNTPADDKSIRDVPKWVSNYALRRYGLINAGSRADAALKAWDILFSNSYNGSPSCWHPTCPRRTIIATRPLLTLYQETALGAGPLVTAWQLLQQAHPGSSSHATSTSASMNPLDSIEYDLVDVGRQVMGNLFWDTYLLMLSAYNRKDGTSFRSLTASMLTLIGDFDKLLATHQSYLFGKWVHDARSWAVTESEADLYEFNARNQLTLWGPKATDTGPTLYGYIQDYAGKNWAGLVSGYYLHRWTLFTSMVQDAIDRGEDFNFESYAKLEIALGEKFCRDFSTKFPHTPTGDTFTVSAEMHRKYGADYTSVNTYTVVQNTDVYSEYNINVNSTWTTSLPQIQFLCDADPACQGFTNTGFLKLDVSHRVGASGVSLYIKSH